MTKTFSMAVPNELYTDDFSEGKTISVTFDGPDSVILLVNREGGAVDGILNSLTDPHNADICQAIEVGASANPAVVYFYTADRRFLANVEHTTITNVDGSTHEEIAEPTIFHYFSGFKYNANDNAWVPQVVVRDKRSALYLNAESNKQYVLDNMSKLEADATLAAMANAYLAVVSNYQTSGNGSIYSWRLTTFDLKDVPQVPPPLVTAILQG